MSLEVDIAAEIVGDKVANVLDTAEGDRVGRLGRHVASRGVDQAVPVERDALDPEEEFVDGVGDLRLVGRQHVLRPAVEADIVSPVDRRRHQRRAMDQPVEDGIGQPEPEEVHERQVDGDVARVRRGVDDLVRQPAPEQRQRPLFEQDRVAEHLVAQPAASDEIDLDLGVPVGATHDAGLPERNVEPARRLLHCAFRGVPEPLLHGLTILPAALPFRRDAKRQVGKFRLARSQSKQGGIEMRRNLGCAAALLLASAGFASLEAQAAPSGEITVWSWNIAAEALDMLVPDFNKKYPDVKVTVVNMGNGDVYDKTLAGCAAGGTDLPDIVTIENNEAEIHWARFPDCFVNLKDVGVDKYMDAFRPSNGSS